MVVGVTRATSSHKGCAFYSLPPVGERSKSVYENVVKLAQLGTGHPSAREAALYTSERRTKIHKRKKENHFNKLG